MDLDLHISIADQSQVMKIVKQLAAEKHITAEQAATELLVEGANRHQAVSPARRMIGLFSSPEDSAIMDDVMDLVAAGQGRYADR